MLPLRELIWSAVLAERQRLSSRAVPNADAPPSGSRPAIALPGFTDDVEALRCLLTLEDLEAAFYRAGLERFGVVNPARAPYGRSFLQGNDDEVRGEGLFYAIWAREPTFEERRLSRFNLPSDPLHTLLCHEQSHLALLTAGLDRLGATTDDESASVLRDPPDDLQTLLITALALENIAAATYAFALVQIRDAALQTSLLSVYADEAQHAGFWSMAGGEFPFQAIVSAPVIRDELVAIA